MILLLLIVFLQIEGLGEIAVIFVIVIYNTLLTFSTAMSYLSISRKIGEVEVTYGEITFSI